MNKPFSQLDKTELIVFHVISSLVVLTFLMTSGLTVRGVEGYSMDPTATHNDAIVCFSHYDELEEGDFIVYDRPDEDTMVGHRIIDITEEEIQTQGDNNDNPDPYTITPSHVDCRVETVIPSSELMEAAGELL